MLWGNKKINNRAVNSKRKIVIVRDNSRAFAIKSFAVLLAFW